MKIQDPLVQLAVSIHTNPGVYALLLGSGVSRAAGIPTGWEIVLDLIRKQAVLVNQDPEPDPAAWYAERYGEEPEYSRILKKLGKTSAERKGLLRAYFEPSDEDREIGIKAPTAAHRAIARLVKLGLIRLIITTNFDRLFEIALQDEGVAPDVVHSPGGLEGANPPVHSSCFVFKIHGDYTDARFRNTTEELKQYPAKYKTFLRRALEDYGLIVCGWSGEWDHALRETILRSPNRRFSTYWLARGAVTHVAQEIINNRKAATIQIQDADSCFVDLQEKIEALTDMAKPDPTSISIAVSTTKRYLAEPRHRIRLHDLLGNETERVARALGPDRFDVDEEWPSEDAFQGRLALIEGVCEPLLSIVASVAFFGFPEHSSLLTSAMERLSIIRRNSGKDVWLALQDYPALLLAYTAGAAATDREKFGLLAALLIDPRKIGSGFNNREPVLARINGSSIFRGSTDLARWLPIENAERRHTPVSDYLFKRVVTVLDEYIPGESQLKDAFELFEFLFALAYVDSMDREDGWAPSGLFGWRHRRYSDSSPVIDFVNRGLAAGDEWSVLRAGFFERSSERFKIAHERFSRFQEKATRSMW